MKTYKSIVVVPRKYQSVKVIRNPYSYPLIGKGFQGAVFLISSNKCVKVYGRSIHASRESDVLSNSQHSPIIPKIYEIGYKYIVMEYINGTPLDKYLSLKGFISKEMTENILMLLSEMEQLNFKRLDIKLRDVIITKHMNMKVLDHVNAHFKQRNVPKDLMNDLKAIGLLKPFLNQLNRINPNLYRKWCKK
ncbi:AarF/UbiB family protein [Natranaerobius thermophilus]|uniref:Serine/threonine protein kinase n=1 Tax=Natranaerobius thermophilus (strain ATCC BAA-1301 / DSM 18059 / JW/NM-WN-LF) TaxID=457570 RepID=B2A4H7_NATTJ|nr:AarF/UbiB family protein [Natranaerobius thermophilus]ACB85154.1 conserved hypothetical protein [Natranaerobius thermophilus JW/NM-WN-LF]